MKIMKKIPYAVIAVILVCILFLNKTTSKRVQDRFLDAGYVCSVYDGITVYDSSSGNEKIVKGREISHLVFFLPDYQSYTISKEGELLEYDIRMNNQACSISLMTKEISANLPESMEHCVSRPEEGFRRLEQFNEWFEQYLDNLKISRKEFKKFMLDDFDVSFSD